MPGPRKRPKDPFAGVIAKLEAIRRHSGETVSIYSGGSILKPRSTKARVGLGSILRAFKKDGSPRKQVREFLIHSFVKESRLDSGDAVRRAEVLLKRYFD